MLRVSIWRSRVTEEENEIKLNKSSVVCDLGLGLGFGFGLEKALACVGRNSRNANTSNPNTMQLQSPGLLGGRNRSNATVSDYQFQGPMLGDPIDDLWGSKLKVGPSYGA